MVRVNGYDWLVGIAKNTSAGTDGTADDAAYAVVGSFPCSATAALVETVSIGVMAIKLVSTVH